MKNVKMIVFTSVLVAGCGSKDADVPKSDNATGKADVKSDRDLAASGAASSVRPFIDEKFVVKPSDMWHREIKAPRAGTIRFRVEAKTPFFVYVVTNHGHEVLNGANPNSIKQEDLLFKQNSDGHTMEDRVSLPPGSSWFLIESASNKEMEVHLECFRPGV
jgi:hypothetical protein